MQFQNAVITPQGRAMLGAANTDKPIKWTRFLFSSSPTRLTGQETELPEPTWGDGSVDAVVSQTELEQFVIYASATNNTDSGYACSYGIFAAQDGVERLVAVANCLGDPTHVTGSSEGYTRFHLALTIKYGVNATVLSVEPNIAGLISRGEFESWMNRVVTTTSPSGAPYGEAQIIYGLKSFRDMVTIGALYQRANVLHFGDYGIYGSVLPIRAPNVNLDLGSSDSKWQNLYVETLHADWIRNKAVMILPLNCLEDLPLGETKSVIPINIQGDVFQPIGTSTDFCRVSWNGTQNGSGSTLYSRAIRSLSVTFGINRDNSYYNDYTRIKITMCSKWHVNYAWRVSLDTLLGAGVELEESDNNRVTLRFTTDERVGDGYIYRAGYDIPDYYAIIELERLV